MQYVGDKLGVSYGILDNIYMDKEYRFTHKCSTGSGSSGSPIVNIYTNKVIGLCESGHKNFNVGTFLNYPIKDFIKINCKNNEDLLKEFNKNNKDNNNISKDDLIRNKNEIINHKKEIEEIAQKNKDLDLILYDLKKKLNNYKNLPTDLNQMKNLVEIKKEEYKSLLIDKKGKNS